MHMHSRGLKTDLKNHLASLRSRQRSAWPGESREFVEIPTPCPPPRLAEKPSVRVCRDTGASEALDLAAGEVGSRRGEGRRDADTAAPSRSGRWAAGLLLKGLPASGRETETQTERQKRGQLMLTRSPLNPKPLPRHLLTPGICLLEVSSGHRAALGSRCAVVVNPGLLRGPFCGR